MSELHPEAAVRNRALSPASAAWGCIKTRPQVAQTDPLSSSPGAGIPHPPAWPAPPPAPPVSIAQWTALSPKLTTRCSTIFWRHKCANFCIENSWSNRHQISLGSWSEARPEAVTLGSSDWLGWRTRKRRVY